VDILAGLLKHQVLFATQVLRRDLPTILAAPVGGTPGQWGHTNFRQPAYTLAYLYQCGLPGNPLRGAAWVRDAAVALIDSFVAAREAEREKHPRFEESEWPPFALCYAVKVFGDTLGADRLVRWRRYIDDYIATELVTPAFFTSPNHELNRFHTMLMAASVFNEPAWRETAVEMCHQLLHWQTAEGFWEEGVHHGPSMKYNHLSLGPLAWLYRLTGDEDLGRAARRLAEFMVRYTFPDGTTVGSFDGRQSMSPGYFAPACPGLELVPGGVTLLQRMIDQRERLGMLDDPRALDCSNWYAYFGIFFVTDACRYFETYLPKTPDARLPIDADGAVLSHHTTTFDGLLARRGPWVVALSGQESDVPKIGSWVYRLERQSRIDLWHERTGVVLGGGHNLTKQAVPLANVIHITGRGPTVEQGEVRDPDEGERRSTFMCRAAETDWTGAVGRLTVHFLHGQVTFEVAPVDSQSAEVRFAWRMQRVKRLAIQVPVIVWRGGRLSMAGQEVGGGGPVSVAAPLRVEHRGRGFAFEVGPPAVGQPYARYPLWPIRTYGQLFAVENFDSPYSICLLGTQIDDPGRVGEGRFAVRVQ
jgi:hypothetical protein